MEDQKMVTVEKQITLASSAKKFYQAPRLTEQGSWTTTTAAGSDIINNDVGTIVCDGTQILGGTCTNP